MTDYTSSSEENVESHQDENNLTPEEKAHRQNSLNLLLEFVDKLKPELLPLTHLWVVEGIDQPLILADRLNLRVSEINAQKLKLKRLFEKQFVKYYITHFRHDMAELIDLIDAINRHQSRRAKELALFLNIDADEVRRLRDQLDQFVEELRSEIL